MVKLIKIFVLSLIGLTFVWTANQRFEQVPILRRYITYVYEVKQYAPISTSHLCQTEFYSDYSSYYAELTPEFVRICNQPTVGWVLLYTVSVYTQDSDYVYKPLRRCNLFYLFPTCQKVFEVVNYYRVYLPNGMCQVQQRAWHILRKGHKVLFRSKNYCEVLNAY